VLIITLRLYIFMSMPYVNFICNIAFYKKCIQSQSIGINNQYDIKIFNVIL
jgi:hypothetical protein